MAETQASKKRKTKFPADNKKQVDIRSFFGSAKTPQKVASNSNSMDSTEFKKVKLNDSIDVSMGKSPLATNHDKENSNSTPIQTKKDQKITEISPSKKKSNGKESHKEEKKAQAKEKAPKGGTKSRNRAGATQMIKKGNIEEEEDIEENIDIRFDKFPVWLREWELRDSKMRAFADPDYDPSTLYIPEREFRKLTPIMKQYWKIKSENFDKLVAIRQGLYYNFYYYDAYTIKKIMHFGIIRYLNDIHALYMAEYSFKKWSYKILEAGYIIIMIEVVEEIKVEGNKDIFNREPVQVLTKATSIERFPSISYHSRYVMCIFEECTHYGIVLIDSTVYEIFIGQFHDDVQRNILRTFCERARPIEIVYERGKVSAETLTMLKMFPQKPIMIPMSKVTHEHPKLTADRLAKYFKTKHPTTESELPSVLQNIFNSLLKAPEETKNAEDLTASYRALVIAIDYLEFIFMAESLIPMSQYLSLESTDRVKGNLFLDDQALENLQVFEVDYFTHRSEENSLFSFIDYTRSEFGKRMLRKWLMAPLLDIEDINSRLDAVEDLAKRPRLIEMFQTELSKLPDLERAFSRFYNLHNKKKLLSLNFYIDYFAFDAVNEILKFIKDLKKIDEFVGFFEEIKQDFTSKRLVRLVTRVEVKSGHNRRQDDENAGEGQKGLFYEISGVCDELMGMFEYKDNLPLPKRSIGEECHKIYDKILEVKEKFDLYLAEQRSVFHSDEITYFHAFSNKNSAMRYQLEFPEQLIEGTKRPPDFKISSKRKGYLRVYTDKTSAYLQELENLEKKFRKFLIPALYEFIQLFFNKSYVWKRMIACLGELDCLCSLAILHNKLDVKCRPQFVKSSEPVFKIRGMTHPCVAALKPGFVRNDLTFESEKNVILLTGPNMGGKSTFLRQACIQIILAQLGSYVPAYAFELTPVDRIFTRIGASDKIFENKSTFFLEMEETLQILNNATKHSFAIIDELGRGTSTIDGIAIADSVLRYLIEKVGCLVLFTTHSLYIANRFAFLKQVELAHMSYTFDSEKDRLTFLYRLKRGAGLSFGMNAAKIAGIPEKVLVLAEKAAQTMRFESNKFESEYNQCIEALIELNKSAS